MRSAPPPTWAAVVAAGALACAAGLSGPPAQAAACSSRTISSIISSGGYVCELGTVRYSFGTDMGELSGGTISFADAPLLQTISFTGLGAIADPIDPDIGFTYGVTVLPPASFQIESASQTFASLTGSSDVSQNTLEALVFPFSTGNLTATLDATSVNLSSITHTIRKTPGPLAIFGAATAFFFSRRLRRRIKQAA
jgi:hypothetical protein